MSNYPFLHRGKELSYIWDANKNPIGQNTIDSSPYFVVKDTSPSQFGSQKYSKLQDFFDDSIDIPYIKTVSRRRQSFVATIVTTVPHNLKVGQAITISGLGGTGYNGTQNVFSVISPTEFTYQNFFGDETTTSDNNGLISYSLYNFFINTDYYNGTGIDYAQINYEVNNYTGLVGFPSLYSSSPFPAGYPFVGWTFSGDHYFKNSNPSIKIPRAEEIFFEGIGTTSYYYINKTRFGDSNGINTRADRRNKRASYNLHVRYFFRGRIRFLPPPPAAGEKIFSFQISGFRGEPTQQFALPPITGYNFFSVYELINKSDYIDICPIKTLHNMDQNVCVNFSRNFTGSNTLVEDFPPFGGWYPPDYPDEVGDFFLGCYNSILNMNLDCHWKSVVLPYFVSFCDPERQFRYSRLETILH